MGPTPDQLRRDIDGTRDHLGDAIGAIEDRVSPRAIMDRRRSAMAERWSAARDAVMGKAEQVSSGAGSAVHSATGAVQEAPQRAADLPTSSAQGNPWAAGVIAFGAGLLAATLLPLSRAEEQQAPALVERVKPLAEDAKRMAADVAAELEEESRDHVEALKEDAREAASQVTGTAQAATAETRDAGRSAAQDIRQTTS